MGNMPEKPPASRPAMYRQTGQTGVTPKVTFLVQYLLIIPDNSR
uniref:Uncharacterized protein n=1 Tax=uncultured bacterium contig00087 TaxID=1181560 RepID=A0A806KH69_9BACT|nr:hypothetical protein [uncultured bacterium contig00087]